MEWKPASYRVVLKGREWRGVRGQRCGCWGLDLRSGDWCLTHTPSGLLAGKFESVEDAEQFILAVNSVADWSKPVAKILRSDPLHAKMRQALEAAGGWK